MISMKIINVTSESYSNIQDFAVAIFSLTDFIGSLCKSITIYVKREKVFEIQRIFLFCNKNNNREEINVQHDFDGICRYNLAFVINSISYNLAFSAYFLMLVRYTDVTLKVYQL